jgi:hypothetical protein
MLRIATAAALALSVVSPAFAVEVMPCGDDGAAHVASITEPWEKNARAFYNGNVRVALTDTGGEPVCCSQHLLVLIPFHDEYGDGRSCFLVNDHGGLGFSGIDYARITTSYDPKKGLLITFPYSLYNEGNPGKGGTAHVRVNVVKGTVEVE